MLGDAIPHPRTPEARDHIVAQVRQFGVPGTEFAGLKPPVFDDRAYFDRDPAFAGKSPAELLAAAPKLIDVIDGTSSNFTPQEQARAVDKAIAAYVKHRSGVSQGARLNIRALDAAAASKSLGEPTPGDLLRKQRGQEVAPREPMGRVGVNKFGEFAPSGRASLIPSTEASMPGSAITHLVRSDRQMVTGRPSAEEQGRIDSGRQEYRERMAARRAAAGAERQSGRSIAGAERDAQWGEHADLAPVAARRAAAGAEREAPRGAARTPTGRPLSYTHGSRSDPRPEKVTRTASTFNPLEAARALKAAGIEGEHTEASAAQIRTAATAGHEELATKSELKAETAALKAEIAALRVELRIIGALVLAIAAKLFGIFNAVAGVLS